MFHGIDALQIRNGVVIARAAPALASLHTFVARLVGDMDFTIKFGGDPTGKTREPFCVINGAVLDWQKSVYFELIGPMTLLAWRAEQNAQLTT